MEGAQAHYILIEDYIKTDDDANRAQTSSFFSSDSISKHTSPLLCPRRTFLAALILASKFLQDRCYSNREWAKLSGLAPREVSRCERALGEVLEWRLWVGKPTACFRSEGAIIHGMRVSPETVNHQIIKSPPMDIGVSSEIKCCAGPFTPQENVCQVDLGITQLYN